MSQGNLFVVLLLTAGATVQAGQDQARPAAATKSVRVGVDIRMRMNMYRHPFNFQGVPAYYRQVPLHPDDGARGIQVTVPFSSIGTEIGIYEFSAQGGLDVEFANRLILRAGIISPVYGAADRQRPIRANEYRDFIDSRNFREVNLYGTAQRGTGQSLVYYWLMPQPRFKFGYFAETEIRASKSNGFLAGAALDYIHYAIERGYDRNNVMQALDIRPFAEIQNLNPYIGLRYYPEGFGEGFALTLYGGPILPKARYEPQATGTVMQKSNWGFQFGINVGGRMILR